MLTLALHENNCPTAAISFAEKQIGRLGLLHPAVIDISTRFAPERRRVEDFISATYASAYDAQISINYPALMSIRNTDGAVLAAAGFRLAAQEPLFLEQYTGAPVEKALAGVYGFDIDRSLIAEAGNLASTGRGATVFLYAALTSYLNHRGLAYLVLTGTDELHRQFIRLGLAPRRVCDADAGALAAGRTSWGSYYSTCPRVLSGSIAESAACLAARMGAEYTETAPALFPRLHYKSHE